jgi:hypothetical protein
VEKRRSFGKIFEREREKSDNKMMMIMMIPILFYSLFLSVMYLPFIVLPLEAVSSLRTSHASVGNCFLLAIPLVQAEGECTSLCTPS